MGRTLRVLASGVMVAAMGFMPACMTADEGDEEPVLEESQAILAGRVLFNQATFGGNGRRCADCHPSDLIGETGTVNPAQVQAKFAANPNGPLFRGDGADVIGGNTFNRIKQHATVLIRMPLPANVSIAGSSARFVDLPRGIPTTMNTPRLDPVLMYDGRDPNLQVQARGAILAHAGSTNVTTQQLNDIADFQKTLFSSPRLRLFANGAPLTMPLGITQSQKRGRRFFIADNSVDPNQVGENKFALCGFCHSGPMLNSLSNFFVTNVDPFPHPEGFRFFTALVSEFNAMGNPVYDFEYHAPDGSVTVVPSPDPGIFLQSGEAPPLGNGWFKIPTCWGVKDTAPYFHDNSSKTLTDLMNHYDDAIFILSETDPVPPTLGQVDLTEQDKLDIIEYLKLL